MPLNNFIGSAVVTLDDKGRCSFPREHRRNLKPASDEAHVNEEISVVITVGPTRSLLCYTINAWNKFVQELNHRPKTPQNIRFTRQVIGMARESVLDKQNRISLSPEQLAYAEIDTEILFLGEGENLSLWQPKKYHDLYSLNTLEDYADLDAGFFDPAHQGT